MFYKKHVFEVHGTCNPRWTLRHWVVLVLNTDTYNPERV